MYKGKYIMRLLGWADKELKGESPLQLIGLEIATRIELALKDGACQHDVQEDARDLKAILEHLREERRERLANRDLWLLMQKSPEYQTFKAWVDMNEMPEQFKEFATDFVAKGEHYG